jgi:glycosyltransferase involved in cell wall biosynthesis
MRLVLLDYAGHAPQVSLSREMARRGHEVLHLFGGDLQTPRGALHRKPDDPATFDVRGITLSRPFKKHSFVVRQLQEIEYGRRFRDAIVAFRPDVVVSSNTPISTQEVVQSACRRRRIPFVYWVMDIYSVAVHTVLAKKLPGAGHLIGLTYQWLERRQLRLSDKVLAISEDYHDLFAGWGVDMRRFSPMTLWAPLAELPVRPKNNPWSQKHGFTDTVNLMYTGTLGFKHNPGLLVELAERMAARPDVRIIVISEGPGPEFIAEQKAARGLTNLVVMPFQPHGEYADVLGTADVLITLLEADAGRFTVSSKPLSYQCAGRPQIASIPLQNRGARVIRDSGGITVSPDDRGGFLAAFERLIADPAERKRLGDQARAYAEREFDLATIGGIFERHLLGVLEPHGTKTSPLPSPA